MNRTRVTLGDALEELIDHRGKTPKKLGGDWTRCGHRVVSAQNIKASRVDDNDHHYISQTMYEKWMKVPLEAGDVLLTSEAPTGEVAYLPDRQDWALGQRLFGLRGKSGLLDGRYLYYALRGGDARHQLMSRATGTTVSGIRQSELVKVELDLPSVEEQHGIAATLGALDDKLESNRRTIQVANELLDALSASLCHSVHGVPLRELVTVERTAVDPNRLANQWADHFSLPAFDDGVRPERVAASTIMSGKLAVDGPSILVSRLNPRFNRTWWAVPTEGVPALASTEFACLTAGSREDLAAVWLAVRDDYFRTELVRRASGTSGSHQRVRPDDLLAVEVPDVRDFSMSAKSDALALLDLIHERRTESATLAEVRDGLLPGLLSGRIRVPRATA